MSLTHLVRRAAVVLVLALAVVAASCGGKSPSSPSPTPDPTAPQYYAAVGASDAVGIGSSVPCPPYTSCSDGTSYVAIIARALAENGRQVTLTNLGIPGAVISSDFQALGASYGNSIFGNFLDQEMPFVPRESTLVTVFAGGNDTNTVTGAMARGAGAADRFAFVDEQIRKFGTAYESLVAGIRNRAPSAKIALLNLPNFAGLPLTAGYAPDAKVIVQRISVGFTTQVINGFAGRNGVAVVDLMCNPRAYDGSIYSSDGFHPNDTGYAFIAEEVLKAVRSSSHPAPMQSCAQMVIAQ